MAAEPETVLAHWSTLIEGLQGSPAEFYTHIQAAVARRMIPGAKFESIEYREGGAFSGFRQYLRIRRHREVFDVCSAPFGNGFFFSWWLAEVKPSMPGIVSIFVFLLYVGIIRLAAQKYGIFIGPIAVFLFVPIALAIARQLGKPEFDDFILMLPLVGPLYERFFQPITYYRIDSSQMFQKAVEASVREVVNQFTAANGVRGPTELEWKPVMRDFFKK